MSGEKTEEWEKGNPKFFRDTAQGRETINTAYCTKNLFDFITNWTEPKSTREKQKIYAIFDWLSKYQWTFQF